MGHFLTKAPHKIVILRALQLGDLLCTVPAFRALRAAYPKAHIALVGLPWAEGFVRRFSHYLDEFIEFPGWPGLPEREVQTQLIPGFLQTLQQGRFNLALQMQGAGTITNPLVALFGAQETAGFYLPNQYRPNNRMFSVYPEGEHEIHKFLRLMTTLGIPSQGEQLEFPVTGEEKANFERFRARYQLQPGQYILLHPGARATQRRWTPDKFAVIGDALAEMGYQVVVTGTAAERDITQAVRQQMRAPALDTAGQTDLGTLALLIDNARLLISNDTGVSHIAAAFETPSLILFTGSDPSRWQPLNHSLHQAVVEAYQVSPEDVLKKVKTRLQEAPPQKATYANEPL